MSRDADDHSNVRREFQLNADGALLAISKGDLTKWEGDAIVNAANERMLDGGGVDGAIHRAAGRELLSACLEEPEVEEGVRCPTGQARITPGFRLPAKHVIHTVGPVYDSPEESAPLLRSAYQASLTLARDKKLRRIAFPAISCGIFGYPLKEAAEIAVMACKDHVGDLEMVEFLMFDNKAYWAWVNTAQEMLPPGLHAPGAKSGPETATDTPATEEPAEASPAQAQAGGHEPANEVKASAEADARTGREAMDTDTTRDGAAAVAAAAPATAAAAAAAAAATGVGEPMETDADTEAGPSKQSDSETQPHPASTSASTSTCAAPSPSMATAAHAAGPAPVAPAAATAECKQARPGWAAPVTDAEAEPSPGSQPGVAGVAPPAGAQAQKPVEPETGVENGPLAQETERALLPSLATQANDARSRCEPEGPGPASSEPETGGTDDSEGVAGHGATGDAAAAAEATAATEPRLPSGSDGGKA